MGPVLTVAGGGGADLRGGPTFDLLAGSTDRGADEMPTWEFHGGIAGTQYSGYPADTGQVPTAVPGQTRTVVYGRYGSFGVPMGVARWITLVPEWVSATLGADAGFGFLVGGGKAGTESCSGGACSAAHDNYALFELEPLAGLHFFFARAWAAGIFFGYRTILVPSPPDDWDSSYADIVIRARLELVSR